MRENPELKPKNWETGIMRKEQESRIFATKERAAVGGGKENKKYQKRVKTGEAGEKEHKL